MDLSTEQEIQVSTMRLIHTRQHTSPKRLGDPGPSPKQIEQILGAAGAAPDHGRLNPWRLIIVPTDRRDRLGAVFAEALFERDAEATELQKKEAFDKAFRGPFLLLAVARLGPELGETHPQERLISAGCAVQNMLLAAHAMGFGAGLSSGRALYSMRMRKLFQLAEHENALCFLTIGTERIRKSPRRCPNVKDYTTEL